MRFFAEFTLERSEGLRMTPHTLPPPQGKRNGFTLLEMVIAIFIIAVVLGFSLIVMGKGMGLSAKSNDVAIATAIAEQEMAKIKNIPFPPTTVYGFAYPAVSGTWVSAGLPYNIDFEVNASSTGYESNGVTTTIINDDTMLRKITVSVHRTRDLAVLATFTTYIARNGTI